MRRRKNLVSPLTGVPVEVAEHLAIGILRTARLAVRLLGDHTAHTHSPVVLYQMTQGKVRMRCLANSVGEGLPS